MDLVMIEHNHFYTRSKPLDTTGNEKPYGAAWAVPKGIKTKFDNMSRNSYLIMKPAIS